MKLTAILLFSACITASAKTGAQTITLNEKNAPLETVLKEIQKQTGYQFIYTVDVIQKARPVSIAVKNTSIEQVLALCFKDQPLDYSIIEKLVVVKEKKSPNDNSAVILSGAEGQARPPIDIIGRVTDKDGNPLVGASVKVKGSSNGTTTNENGDYTLHNVDENATLEITYIGYEPLAIALKGRNNIFSSLAIKPQSLNEVIINKGYYSTTQKLNTGDVTKVSGEDIRKQPVSDPIAALEGRVSGLFISQSSGIPGSGLTVQLRGQSSIANGTNPLYIVDGIPFTSASLTNANIGGGAIGSGTGGSVGGINSNSGQGMSPFNSLDPSIIESIEVLKDADATAIYGSRGANGVILITTKRGKSGKTKVDFNISSGIGKVTRMMKLLNTQQYLVMRHKAFYNDSISDPANYIPPDPNYDYDILGWDTTRYTDWQKMFIGGKAKFTNVWASISGGSTNTQFVINGGYNKQTTVFPGDYSDAKASLHFNLRHASNNQKFHTLFSTQYVNDNSLLPREDFTANLAIAPDAPELYDATGNLNWQNGTWTNPLAPALRTAKAVTNNLIGDLNVSYEILSGLELKGNFGYTHIQLNQSNIIPLASYDPSIKNSALRQNNFATTNVETWIAEPQMNYIKRIGRGRFDALVGATLQSNNQNSLAQRASNFTSDALISNIASASTISVVGNSVSKYNYSAVFGRVNYDWQEKYIVNLTARRDGSSRFGPGKQIGNFGAIGTGWIFSSEKFVEHNLPFLSFGKIRASYGTTGNDQIPDYQYLSTYSNYTPSTYLGLTGLIPTRIANPLYGWEVVRKVELGIELGFIKDKIFLTANYYRNRTGNQLVGQPLPSIDGFTTIQANLPAVIQNTGLELGLNTVNAKTNYFTWTSSINVSFPRNKLVAFPNLTSNSTYRYSYVVGKSVYTKFQYHYLGVDPATGIYTFEDVNKDGQLDINDRQFLKQVGQNYYGGFQNTFSYKGWQLDVFFQFVKQTGYNYLLLFNQPGTFNSNQPSLVLSAWQSKGNNSSVQQYSASYGSSAADAYSNIYVSDATITDASFVRLKNLAVSYNLPESWQNKMHIQNARMFLQCQNLFTVTKYQGLDPENQSYQGFSLPPLRMITVGIQLGL